MKLFLHQIVDIKNFGVKLVCIDEYGKSYMLDKPYVPYFFAVDLKSDMSFGVLIMTYSE